MSSRLPSRRAALALATLPLAGCSTFRPDPASGVPLPPRLASATAEAANWPDPLWWRGFGSPELDALMERAVAANFDIRAAIARVRQADAQVRITGQALLPTGNLTASATRSQTPIQTATAVSVASTRRFTQREIFQTGLSASYEIDFWGKNRAAVVAAEQAARANRFDVAAVTLTTEASVANTYFAIVAAREQLAIQQSNVEAAQRTLNLLQQRLAAGTSTGLDIAQQQTALEQQRAAIPPLRQTVEQSSFALATLTGVTPAEIAVTALRLGTLRVPTIAPGLPAALLLRRPDVRYAEANLTASSANVTAARAALFPTITLTGSGGIQSLALETLLRPGSVLYTLTAGITAPIFDGGSLRAQVDQARGRQEELVANYRRAILSALEDAESSLSALQRSTELVRLQAAREAAARRAFDIADSQLRAGTIDLLTVLTTQTSLFSARDAVAQAQTQQLQAAASLFTALGGGWTAADAASGRTAS